MGERAGGGGRGSRGGGAAGGSIADRVRAQVARGVDVRVAALREVDRTRSERDAASAAVGRIIERMPTTLTVTQQRSLTSAMRRRDVAQGRYDEAVRVNARALAGGNTV